MSKYLSKGKSQFFTLRIGTKGVGKGRSKCRSRGKTCKKVRDGQACRRFCQGKALFGREDQAHFFGGKEYTTLKKRFVCKEFSKKKRKNDREKSHLFSNSMAFQLTNSFQKDSRQEGSGFLM